MRSLIASLLLGLGCGKGAQNKQVDWHRTPLKQLSAHTGSVDFDISLPEDWEPRKAPDVAGAPRRAIR